MQLRVSRRAWLPRFLFHPAGKIVLGALTFLMLLAAGAFTYTWIHFSRLIEEKLVEGPWEETAMLLAAPEEIKVGDPVQVEEIVSALRRRGYSQSPSNRLGWYRPRPEGDGVEIYPSRIAAPEIEGGIVYIKGGRVEKIHALSDHSERRSLLIEPELITNLFDRNRQKRRVVSFNDIPQVLIHAVLSAEDKRFFQHSGFDPIRIIRTAWVDVTQNRRYGASTISMQLARMIWLTPEKTPKRKAAEVLITLQIEQKLSKEQIFEYYANHVDLGQRQSFAIRGFGEAAQVYFGKDIRELNAPEAALLAGLIQRPNFLNPYRHPERARQRRDIVLNLMKENGYLTDLQYVEAISTPVKLASGGIESTDAPYFVDLVLDNLKRNDLESIDFQSKSYRVYTTLDLGLQRDAVEAVRIGMAEVDALLAKKKNKYPQPQVALVAVDPHTAEVKALIGGRSYGQSQLNRALARRQPGSVFKPFVYAAVLGLALEGGQVVTPVTQVDDEPRVFEYDGREYAPNNFRQQFNGRVTLRQALAKSLNVPTVSFAEIAGYERVAELARRAGLSGVRGTPSAALGSYEATPLEVAGAYTIFSNAGVMVEPVMVREVRSAENSLIYKPKPVQRPVLDPRISYMVVSLMQDVINHGTAAGARSRGFLLPAAGKTGTSHDAWFAGFTSKLLCVVWVGFDDNQELPLEGGKAALPIWTEFMKRAHARRQYRTVTQFAEPDGITFVEICPLSRARATDKCHGQRTEVFLAGTEPGEMCPLHPGSSRTQIARWDDEPGPETAAAAGGGSSAQPVQAGEPSRSRIARRAAAPVPQQPQTQQKEPARKGVFRSFWDFLRGKT